MGKKLISIWHRFGGPKTNWKYVIIVVILGFLATGGIGIYSKWAQKQLESSALSITDFHIEIQKRPTPLSIEPIELKNEFIAKNEIDIIFFQNNEVWAVNKDLTKKYKIPKKEFEELSPERGKYRSQNGKLYWISQNGELYWIEDGELLKKDKEGKIKILVSKKEMKKEVVKDLDGNPLFSYLKGKVVWFSLSSDEKYIAYAALEGYTGCCLSLPDIPYTWIWIMRTDGTGKVKIEEPKSKASKTNGGEYSEENLGIGMLIPYFDWIPNTHILLVQFRSVLSSDAVRSGFYKFDVKGKYLGIFPVRESDKPGIVLESPTDAPYFSPDGTKMVYFEKEYGPSYGVIKKMGIATLENGEIKDRKIIVLEEDVGIYPSSAINILWSDNGHFFVLFASKKNLLFKANGEKIFEEKSELETNWSDSKPICWVPEFRFSPDDKYYAKSICLDKKGFIFTFVDLDNKKAKTFIQEWNQKSERNAWLDVSCFFSKNIGKFYYLVTERNRYNAEEIFYSALWVLDPGTRTTYKIADNVSRVVRAP